VVGSALTLMNCLGYSLSVISVALLSQLQTLIPVHWLPWLLLPGPVLGLCSLTCLRRLQVAHSRSAATQT